MLKFDLVSENNFLKVYKYASENNIPIRYVFPEHSDIISNDPIELQKINIYTLNDDISKEQDIIKLINKYILYKDDYTMDIIFLYYEMHPNLKEELKNILVENNIIDKELNFDDEYKLWKEKINKEIENDKIFMNNHIEYLTYINNLRDTYISKPFIKDCKLMIKISSDKKNFIDVFDKTICNPKLLLVKYNNGFQKFFKLYEDENIDFDFERVENIDIEDQHILFIYNINNKFIYLDYNISSGYGETYTEGKKSIEYSIIDILINEIKKLPVNILRIDYYDLNGYYGIYGIPFYNDIIASYILEKERFFLFINERTKSLFEQNQLFITYNTPDEVNYGIHKYTIRIHYDIEKLQDDLQYNIMYTDPITNKLTSDYKDKNYILNGIKNIDSNFTDDITIINFSNATLNGLYYFMFYFNKLSYDYFTSIEMYKNNYDMYLPNYELKLRYTREPILGMKRIQILKDKSKEVMVSDYARICQKEKQPIIIDEEEYNLNLGNPRYTIITSIDKDKKYYYKCPDDKYIYAVKLKNTKLANAEIFPEIPCCSELEKTRGQKSFSDFIKFVDGKILIENPIIQERINNIGVVSYPLKNDKLLNGKLILNMEFNYKSFVNSMHLINYIINKGLENSISLLNTSIEFNHEEFKNQVKEKYKDLTFIRQELYDIEQNSIFETFLNADIDDEEYYYKFVTLFEEIYDINIYVIENNEFVKPRYKFNYFKRPRKHGIILSRRLEKQYNIVLNMDGKYYKNVLLNEEENKKFNDMYMNYSYLIKGKIKNYDKRNKIIILDKLYNENFRNNITNMEQLIDGYGKSRGFIYNNIITYIIEPDEPYNIKETRNVKEIDINLIYEKYKNYIQSVDYNDDELNGIWLTYDNLNIYIPVHETSKNLEINLASIYSVGNKNPYIISVKDSSYFRYLNLENTLIKILQILYWLIIIGYKENINILNLLYLQEGEEQESINEYNIQNIPSQGLPNVSGIYEALTWLYNLNINLIIIVNGNYKIRMYSNKFFYGIEYYIKEFMRHNNIEILNKNEVQFRRKFHTSKDFDIIKNNTLLIGDTAFNNWKIYYNKIKTKKYNFNNLITIDENYVDPYYFTYQDNYYIIQNVKDGNLYRAIKLGLNWIQNKINTGYNTEISNYLYEYTLYDKSFMRISGIEEDIQLLKIKEGKYAAILKLEK